MAAPSLDLSPDVQARYVQAMSDPSVANDPQAVQYVRQQAQAQSAREQQARSVPASPSLSAPAQPAAQPSYGGLKGVFLNADSPLNLSTVGSVAGGVIGGALGTLAGPGGTALGAIAGSTLGGGAGEALREKDSGQKLNESSIGGQALLGGVSDGAGQVLGAGLKVAAPAASKLLSEQAERLGLGALGISRPQSAAFGVQTGTPLGQFLSENGLIGKSASDVSALKSATQDSYDAIARQSGIQVPVSDVNQSVANQVTKLRSGVSSDSHDAAQAIEDEYQAALSHMGVDPKDPNATVDIGKLTDAKSEYQRQVNWKNPENINEVKGGLSSALLDAVNGAAGDATDAQGNSLSQIGKKLQGLNLIDQWAQKAANTTGVSKGPLTLGNLARPALGALTGSVAGPVGGVLGAAGGVIGDVVANSPGAIRATAGLYKAGAGVADRVAGSSAPAAVAGVAGTLNKMAAPVVSSAASPASVPAVPSLSAAPSPGAAPAPDADPLQSGAQALAQGQALSQNQYQALIEKDLATTGGRYQAQITAAYQAGNPAGVQGLGVASSAMNTLTGLYDQAGGAKGPISGSIENALGKTGLSDQSVQAYNKQSSALGQEIISQIYGSSGTASDRDQVLSLIPQVNDSAQVAASKMATLKALIQQRLSSMTSSTPSSVSAAAGPSLAGATP